MDDLAWPRRQGGPPCFASRKHLALAGAHHRTGSEMLTRVMGALCKRCCLDGSGRRVARWKAAGSPCQVDSPAALSGAQLNASHAAGLRLFSSGAWDVDPAELPRALPAAPWRLIHLVRDPFDAVLSAYHYHKVTAEPWVHVPAPAWYRRMGLRPPLAAPNLSFAQQLRALGRIEGVVLQARHSRRGLATMVAVAERCAQVGGCTNLRLEAFQADYDAAATALLRGLGAVRGVLGELRRVARRAGRLSPAQASNSTHVTRGKHRAEAAALLAALHAAPSVGPALRRLRARLRGGAAPPPCAYGDEADHEADDGAGPAAGTDAAAPVALALAAGRGGGGWWSSAEDVHILRGEVPTAAACCARCRAAAFGCLYFNWQRLPMRLPGGGARHRCTLLTSRLKFTPGARFVSGAS